MSQGFVPGVVLDEIDSCINVLGQTGSENLVSSDAEFVLN